MSGTLDWQTTVTQVEIDLVMATNVLGLQSSYAGTITNAGNALHHYVGIIVWLSSNVAAAHDVGVYVVNNTKGLFASPQSLLLPPSGGGILVRSLFFPLACDTGDTIMVELVNLAGAAVANAVGVQIFGLASMPPNVPILRPDGRLPVVGYHGAGASVGATGSTTLIAASGGAGATMLKKVVLTPGNTSAGVIVNQVLGTLAGNAVALGTIFGGAAFDGPLVLDYDDGLLLDPNTAVTLSLSGGGTIANNTDCRAFYDVSS